MDCTTPGFPVLHYPPELAQTHAHWVSDASLPSHHLLPFLSSPQSFPASGSFPVSQPFTSALYIKYWSFNLSPSNEYSGLISFRMDWSDLLAVQGTLKSLLQHHFKTISSLVFSLLYGPTLTSIHNYWKNHSFDYTDLCQQSDLCFLICSLGSS